VAVEGRGVGQHREPHLVDSTLAHGVHVGGHAVEDVVGHDDERGACHHVAPPPGAHLAGGGGVDDGEVEPAVGDVAPETGVGGQLFQLGGVEVGQDHRHGQVAQGGGIQEPAQPADEPIAQATRPRAELEHVHPPAAVQAAGGITVPQKGDDHLGVAGGDHGVRRDGVGHLAVAPGPQPLPLVVGALEVPQPRPGQGHVLLQHVAGRDVGDPLG